MTKAFILGLTGSIGMGKSAVATMFAELGVPVFDADAAVHRLQGPGGALLSQIEAAFPASTDAHGVKRADLGARVFGKPEELGKLEAIVHPAVHAMRQVFLLEHDHDPLILFDIPLLYERGGAGQLDAVAVVSAPADIQRARVLARPGMTPEKFAHILGLQVPDAEKRARADFMIDTGVPLSQTRAQVAALVARLREKKRS